MLAFKETLEVKPTPHFIQEEAQGNWVTFPKSNTWPVSCGHRPQVFPVQWISALWESETKRREGRNLLKALLFSFIPGSSRSQPQAVILSQRSLSWDWWRKFYLHWGSFSHLFLQLPDIYLHTKGRQFHMPEPFITKLFIIANILPSMNVQNRAAVKSWYSYTMT